MHQCALFLHRYSCSKTIAHFFFCKIFILFYDLHLNPWSCRSFSLHHNHLTQTNGWYVPGTLSRNDSQHASPLRASVIAFTFTPAQSGTPFSFSQENPSSVCTGSDLGPEKEGDELWTPKKKKNLSLRKLLDPVL